MGLQTSWLHNSQTNSNENTSPNRVAMQFRLCFSKFVPVGPGRGFIFEILALVRDMLQGPLIYLASFFQNSKLVRSVRMSVVEFWEWDKTRALVSVGPIPFVLVCLGRALGCSGPGRAAKSPPGSWWTQYCLSWFLQGPPTAQKSCTGHLWFWFVVIWLEMYPKVLKSMKKY